MEDAESPPTVWVGREQKLASNETDTDMQQLIGLILQNELGVDQDSGKEHMVSHNPQALVLTVESAADHYG